MKPDVTSASPQRKSRVEKRLRSLLAEDLCQAIAAVQGLLPQFPYFEERFRGRFELWNLPPATGPLPQSELDALSPFHEDLAGVVGGVEHDSTDSTEGSFAAAPSTAITSITDSAASSPSPAVGAAATACRTGFPTGRAAC